jgi:STE24 endopeptidase
VVSPAGYSSIANPAVLPLLLFLFGGLSAVISPLTNAYSRHVESQADNYALELTNNPEAFVDSMTRLANQNLALADPPRWEEFLFYSHPSYNRRVKQARLFKQEENPKRK